MARKRSAACEFAISRAFGGSVGRGEAIALEVVVAIVGDWRREMG
jgi:hypothetical protein